MRSSTAEKPVRQIACPPEARALSTLPRVDYADAFVLATGPHGERTALHWARAVLEDAPPAVRRTLQSGWAALGLRLGRERPERSVLGWGIRVEKPDLVLLGAGSRVGMPGELLFRREDEALLLCTFVRFAHPVARAVWAGVEPTHVRVVAQVLEQAGRRVRG